MAQPHKIKIRINRAEGRAVVIRDVYYDHKAIRIEVLASNGKWREKAEYEALFEDEKLPIEEV